MEPIWLGLSAPKLISAASAVGHRAAEPFGVALEAARSMLREESAPDSTPAVLAPAMNPHLQLLSEMLTGQSLGGNSSRLEIDDIRTHADDLQVSLQRRIRQLLDRSGIDHNEPVRLRVSPLDGQLEVEGDTPQRAVLEAALASDPSIAADIRQLVAMRSLTSAATENAEFVEAYARDPNQAVLDYAELFDTGQSLVLQSNQTTAELRFVPN